MEERVEVVFGAVGVDHDRDTGRLWQSSAWLWWLGDVLRGGRSKVDSLRWSGAASHGWRQCVEEGDEGL